MDIQEFEIKEGRHMLSGIDGYNNGESLCDNVTVLCIDGINYGFYEDPDDGYRSYGAVEELPTYECRYTFPPQPVDLAIKEVTRPLGDYDYMLEFKDATNGKVVLKIGTENLGDWYPCAIFEWNPENLEINKNVRKI